MTPHKLHRCASNAIVDNSSPVTPSFSWFRLTEAPWFRSEHMRDEPILQPVGSTVRLRCRAEGTPRPQVTWYKDGRVIHNVPETGGVDLQGSRHTLKVSNLMEEDSGRYMCWVQNRAGSINFTYTLEVIGRMMCSALVAERGNKGKELQR